MFMFEPSEGYFVSDVKCEFAALVLGWEDLLYCCQEERTRRSIAPRRRGRK